MSCFVWFVETTKPFFFFLMFFFLLMKSYAIQIFPILKLFAFYPIRIRFLHVVTNLCGRKVRNGAGPSIRYPIPKLVKPKIRKPRYLF